MFGQVVSFGNLVPPFPIGVAAIFFLQSHYIGMLRSQSSCTVGGSTRNELTPSYCCGEMATLRMTRTPKKIGRKFWVQSVFIFVLIIKWF